MPVINDLIEINYISSNSTYTLDGAMGGRILGVIDGATYQDNDSSNTATEVHELNDGWGNSVLTIDGVDYHIEIIVPNGGGQPVTVSDASGSQDLYGDGHDTQVVFIMGYTGSGETRYFMSMDDSIGDVGPITRIQTRELDLHPAGGDVQIDLSNNDQVFICFCPGARILTPSGPRPVQELQVGDLVVTLDNGAQPIRWAGHSVVPPHRGLRVLIRKGALAPGQPQRDLRVSLAHRVLVSSKIAERLFGLSQVLVPAKLLCAMPGIALERPDQPVVFHHLLMARHEVLFAEDAPVESLLVGARLLDSMDDAVRATLPNGYHDMTPARPVVERADQAQMLVKRHRKNAHPLLQLPVRPPQAATDSGPALRLVQI